jgi:hypothetical protein
MSTETAELLARVIDRPTITRMSHKTQIEVIEELRDALIAEIGPEYIECESTMHTWTYGFSPNAVDSYYMTCDLTYPHDEHENSHTGAKWRDPVAPSSTGEGEK